MVIDFNRLNLIEARLKRLKKNSPAAWSVVMDCGHQHVLSDEQIHKPDEQRYGEDLYYCAKCAIGDRTGTGDEDFCTRTVFHKIEMATPMFSRQLKELQQQQQGSR